MFSTQFILAALSLLGTISLAAPQCPRSDFCVTITPSGDQAIVTVASSQSGWAGVGFGTTSMSGNAPAYIGWTNSNEGATVSQRTVGGHYTPNYVGSVAAVSTPSGVSSLGGVTFSFQLPLSSLGSGSIYGIYASSGNAPFSRDDPSSGFYQHDVYGAFVLQIPAGSAPAAAPPTTTAAAAVPPVTTTEDSKKATAGSTGTSSQKPANPTTVNNNPIFVDSTNSNLTSYCYDQTSSFCVATVKDATTVTFTVYSSAQGWVGIGTGSFMDGSTMFVAWKNGSDVVISQRSGHGEAQPSYNSKPVFTKVATPSSVTVPSSANLVFSFQLPISSGLASVTGQSSFIFATSDQTVYKPADAASDFPQHALRAGFTLDLSKGGSGSTNGGSGVDLLLLHGIFMFIAWAVIPPVAIFIARYLKKALGHKWYLSHTGLFIFGTGGLIIAGLVTVEVNLAPGVTRFVGSSTHGIIGTIVALALYPLQCLLGFASNYFFDENRTKVAVIDQVHWWVGRSVVLLAIVNMYLGLVQYGASVGWIAAYWLFVLLVPAGLIFYGEKKLGGVVHHVASDDSEKAVETLSAEF